MDKVAKVIRAWRNIAKTLRQLFNLPINVITV